MPNRTLLIAGNWKMNNDVAEAAKLADELAQALPEVPAGVEVLVRPRCTERVLGGQGCLHR